MKTIEEQIAETNILLSKIQEQIDVMGKHIQELRNIAQSQEYDKPIKISDVGTGKITRGRFVKKRGKQVEFIPDPVIT